MRCDALHCGRREYLHDDLEAITLAQSVLAAPPLELWPEVIVRVTIPQNIEQGLLIPIVEVLLRLRATDAFTCST